MLVERLAGAATQPEVGGLPVEHAVGGEDQRSWFVRATDQQPAPYPLHDGDHHEGPAGRVRAGDSLPLVEVALGAPAGQLLARAEGRDRVEVRAGVGERVRSPWRRFEGQPAG